jgi:hypothetical protein
MAMGMDNFNGQLLKNKSVDSVILYKIFDDCTLSASVILNLKISVLPLTNIVNMKCKHCSVDQRTTDFSADNGSCAHV